MRPAPVQTPLSSLATRALDGPLIAPPFQLMQNEAGPFLGKGWPPQPPNRRQPGRRSNAEAELHFYLTQPFDLRFGIQARGKPGIGTLFLNGEPLGKLTLSDGWNRFQTSLPSAQLLAGENTLKLCSPAGATWDALQLTPLNEGVGLAETPNGESGSEHTTFVRFGHSLEFPLDRTYESLRLEHLEPWSEAGAPLAKDAKLRIRLNKTLWTLEGRGRIRLPDYVPPAVLSLEPRLEQPLPGQMGLQVRASLQSWRVTDSVEPESSKSALPSSIQGTPIILYVIDALRADGLGCYNPSVHNTPNLDALAQEAVVFYQANAQSSWTKPAMASILSGQIPLQHGAEDEADRVLEKAPWLPELLRQKGYRTAAFSANPLIQECFGFERGFEEFHNFPEIDAFHLNGFARQWLPENSPFFLYLHCLEPHSPYRPEKGAREIGFDEVLRDRSLLPALRTNYASEIARNDRALGELIGTLKKQQLYDKCLLIVVADHGEEFLDHGQLSHANSLYQELIRIPLIIKFPHQQGAGTKVNQVIQQIDLAPTVLKAAGIPIPDGMSGEAFWPGKSATRERPVFFSIGLGRQSLVPRRRSPRVLEMRGVRLGPWVLTRTQAANLPCAAAVELFNLDRDPLEKHNLWAEEPGYRAALWGLLQLQSRVPSGTSQASWKETEKALRTLNYLR